MCFVLFQIAFHLIVTSNLVRSVDIREVKQFPVTGGWTLDSKHLFIGNDTDDVANKSEVGSITLYPRYGTEVDYSMSRKLAPTDGERGDRFGQYIKVNDDYLLVAAPGTDGTNLKT